MTIATKILPLFGASTSSGKSAVVTNQRRVNCYFERRPDKDKTEIACYGTPGLLLKWTLATPGGVPVRGMLGQQSSLYAAASNKLYSVSSGGVLTSLGTLSTSSGQVSLAYNTTQVVAVDGTAGYLWNGSAFSTLPASFPNGAKTVTFVSSFFAAEQPGTQNFWVSAANDGSTWPALAFAAASAYSDNILAVDNLSGNLVLLCQQHTEFWQNVGAANMPFAAIVSATNEYGLAAIYSRAHVEQSLIFLAQTREGAVQFVRLTGYAVKVISDADIDEILGTLTTVSDAVALTYQVGQHKFYQCTFPTANRSFLYDLSTGLWSEVQTGTSSTAVRHQALLSTYYAGGTILCDYANGNIYTMSETNYTDNGTAILRQLVTRHILSHFNYVRISALYLDMETAVGSGFNPTINVEYSKDNGRTYGGLRAKNLGQSGATGANLTRVLWRRFGCTRDATFRCSMTDNAKFVIANAAMRVKA